MIPVHAPVFEDLETAYVMEALAAGEISGTSGRFILEFERAFAEYCHCRYGVAVNSGTAALHVAAIIAGIGQGDEVLVSASTNIATANAVVQQGGRVVAIDSELDTWNMDVTLLEHEVTTRTKAIMPVHLFGHPVDMGEVMRVARRHGLTVIEDCAQAHGATYMGCRVGSIGDMGCFSFYANKVISCGEGGMIVTNRKDVYERARLLRNLAFKEPRFVHEEMGFNYRMTNIQAAIGLAQLTRIDEILQQKRHIAEQYTFYLSGIPSLRLPVEKDYAKNVYWMYGIVLEDDFGLTRDELMQVLRVYGVDTRTMFCPMHMQPSLLRRGAVRTRHCREAEYLWEHGMYLPSGCSLSDRDIEAICHVIQEAAGH